ncbi:MAG TPA: hypothetical protein VEV42_08060 [Pyrinomonadaceae bacterium]|nr:hypothetical protein [Pyrinomonadaceae bacterium]
MRLLLAISVSIWMAGGCLFGCSNMAMAADASAPAIVAGESCHASHSHDCCAAKKPKKQLARASRELPGVPTFGRAASGMMNDCPLVVNATAVTATKSGHSTDPARGPILVSPFIASTREQAKSFVVVSSPPNRGPTYLRYCVFLI